MSSNDVNRFLELETQVWTAMAEGDATADERLLADDFFGVYADGFAEKADHVGQLADGPKVASYHLSGGRIQLLAEEAVLLSYRADWVRHTGEAETMYVTSVWKRFGTIWKNVFSQDTPAGG